MRARPRLALRSPWKRAARWWSTGASWSRRRTAPVSRWKGSEGAGDDRGGRRDPQGHRTARAPSVHRRGSRGVAAAARALAATRKAERVRELHPRGEVARARSLGARGRRANRDPLARPAAAGRPGAGGPGARGPGEGRAQAGIRAGRLSELLVVALEASADLHGAAVLRELKALRPGLRAFGAGGPRMRAAGFEALARAEDVSVMGIAEVLPALPQILETMDVLYDAARERRPRAALLIDSPDFNLRLARRLRRIGIPVAYFIGPSVSAWRTHRARRGDAAEVELVDGRAPEVLARADAAIVASGTATLEAALALTPMVVVYRASWLTWWIGRMLVRVKFLSLVNLISGRAVVPELLQRECTPERIAAAVEPLLSATPARTAQLDALRAIRAELAPEGSPPAARRAAEAVLALLVTRIP